MISNLTEAKNNVSRLNLDYMDINSKIAILQNHELLVKVEYLEEELDKIKEEKKKLIKKIKDLKNDIDIHKQLEINLVLKINENKFNSNIQPQKKQNQKCTSLNKFRNTSFYTRNDNKLLSLFSNNSSNIFKMDQSGFGKNNIFNKNNTISKSLTSYDNKILSNEIENNFSFSRSGNQASLPTQRELNFKKFNKIIKAKNEEIENLKLKVEKLSDKLNIYFNRYNGLFSFLEECLNEFFNDQKILNIKTMNINIEDIKKFDFNCFNKEEKYSILILLMNHLMPILTLNFKSNCNLGNNIFTTNLNLIDKNFNYKQKYLNDFYLQNAFKGKNKKVLNEFHMDRKNNKFGCSIPILRKHNFLCDYKLLDNRFKTLI